jgi:subtilisin family serine protease
MHVPKGINALAARDLLRSELPNGRFALNHVYRAFRSAGADRGDGNPHAPGMRRATVGGCNLTRCYAPAIMEWEPQSRICAKDVRVGVIDTSVDVDHPAFKGRTVRLANFLPDGAARTVNWHGTAVLGVLAGHPESGTPGLVPDAEFFLADVFHADENGHPIADTMGVIQALNWMSAQHVAIINMSMAGQHDLLLQEAIERLSRKGIVFVAAAGNEGPTAPPSYPAAYPQVIAVTAIDKDLRSYSHANHGDYIDVAAPGVRIWTAFPNAMEGQQSGTSFAAPHVTAVLAALYNQVPVKTKESFLRAMRFRDLGAPGPDLV